MVRSSARGAVVLGAQGVRYLDAGDGPDAVEGEDPTLLFGPHTADSLRREDAMLHAPDILALSQYDPELGEVAAFEELIGSHGGLGGFQTRAVHPPSRPSGSWTSRSRSGAPAIYRNLRRWLGTIGIDLAKAPAPVVEPAATEPSGSVQETGAAAAAGAAD